MSDTKMKLAALEFFDRWLRGTTCHHRRREIVWQDGPFVLFKHHGHSEWCGAWIGNRWCPTYYVLYDIKRADSQDTLIGHSWLWKHEGRWSDKLWDEVGEAKRKQIDKLQARVRQAEHDMEGWTG